MKMFLKIIGSREQRAKERTLYVIMWLQMFLRIILYVVRQLQIFPMLKRKSTRTSLKRTMIIQTKALNTTSKEWKASSKQECNEDSNEPSFVQIRQVDQKLQQFEHNNENKTFNNNNIPTYQRSGERKDIENNTYQRSGSTQITNQVFF